MDIVDALWGWGTVVLVIVVPAALGGIGVATLFTSRPLETRYPEDGGGLAGGYLSGLEAVFSPLAHEAHIERDRQTKRTAPAPAPGDPPWAIDGNSIRIDL